VNIAMNKKPSCR